MAFVHGISSQVVFTRQVTASAGSGKSIAVITQPAGHDFIFGRFPLAYPVSFGDTEGHFISFGAAGGHKETIHAGEVSQHVRAFVQNGRYRGKSCQIAQLYGLLPNNFGNIFTAIAQRYIDSAGAGV